MMAVSGGQEPLPDDGRVWAYMDVPSDQNVTISNSTAAACGWTNVEIDGVDMGTSWNNVPLTAGTHLLKYTLADSTKLGSLFRTRNYYTKILLPPTITTIGNSAFLNTYNNPVLKMDKSKITTIEYRAFYGEGPKFGNIDFPNLSTLGGEVWNGYMNPGGAVVKNLGSVTSLPSNVFNQARILKYDIPATVTEVATRAFFNGYVGTSMEITMRPTTPPTYGSSAIYRVKKIFVPAGSVQAYKTASGWSSWANVIEAIPE